MILKIRENSWAIRIARQFIRRGWAVIFVSLFIEWEDQSATKLLPVGDGSQPVGPEGVFRVHIDHLSPGVAVGPGHLGRHAEGVRELGLARTELSKGLRDGHGLQTSAQKLVQLAAPRGQTEDVPPVQALLKIKLRLKITPRSQLPGID